MVNIASWETLQFKSLKWVISEPWNILHRFPKLFEIEVHTVATSVGQGVEFDKNKRNSLVDIDLTSQKSCVQFLQLFWKW